MHELSDEELVSTYQAHSGSARGQALLNELFGRHHRRVAAWCYRMTGDRESAADLAQDIFLRAFRSLPSFRSDSKFTTWLYTITRNHCMNALRSQASRPEDSGVELLDLPADEEGIDVLLERQNAEQILRGLMLEVLDETERSVMLLHYVEELPLDSITRLLGLQNTSGAKAFIVSAKRKLNSAIVRRQQRVQNE